jgi:hypothetical protein
VNDEVLDLLLLAPPLDSFHPAKIAARATAKGTHSFLIMKVPTTKRAEGM